MPEPMVGKVLFKVNVGSHMWGMQRHDSDLDVAMVMLAPNYDLLTGIGNYNKSVQLDPTPGPTAGTELDIQQHELGKVVDRLLKDCNINYFWIATSPIVLEDPLGLREQLKNLAMMNLTKKIFGSANGLAKKNYMKYIESGKDLSEKRCNMVARSIVFAIKLLQGRGLNYNAYYGATPAMITKMMDNLKLAWTQSKLPEEPPAKKQMLDWLYDVRMEHGGFKFDRKW